MSTIFGKRDSSDFRITDIVDMDTKDLIIRTVVVNHRRVSNSFDHLELVEKN
jgi:hypothetical protein